MPNISIPPSQEIRDKLAAAQVEARYLRLLLKLAREREEAESFRVKAKGREAKK